MAAERTPQGVARPHRAPLIVVFSEDDGEEFVCYESGEAACDALQRRDVIDDALRLAGAWSDRDWDEMAAELDRIRHESPPTPPVEL